MRTDHLTLACDDQGAAVTPSVRTRVALFALRRAYGALRNVRCRQNRVEQARSAAGTFRVGECVPPELTGSPHAVASLRGRPLHCS